MSQQNVEVVRRFVEAWNRCDLTTWLATFRSDAEIDWSRARGPFKGVYRGHGELEVFWDVFWSTWEDVQLETYGLTEAGSEVVLSNTAHFRGRRRDQSDCEEHVRVHIRERADRSASDVSRASRSSRIHRAAGHRPGIGSIFIPGARRSLEILP
jgi:ketosteroid isomerase-like protein